MRRLPIPQLFAWGLFLALVADATAASPPVRTANSRQVTQNVRPVQAQTPTPLNPLPPAPLPAVEPTPGASTPQAVPASPASPPLPSTAPVPSPDPGGGGGTIYYQPFGTMKDRTPPPKQYLGDPDGSGSFYTPTDAPTPLGQPLPVLDPNAPLAATDRFGVAPPPGTLGHTYHRRSRELEDKKHPRVGIVEVHLSENYDVSAKGLKSKWTGKVWELESDPLLPGIPHIFEIKAEWGPDGARQKEVRTVRLIMGRAVDLEF